jgi:hypothetical protein
MMTFIITTSFTEGTMARTNNLPIQHTLALFGLGLALAAGAHAAPQADTGAQVRAVGDQVRAAGRAAATSKGDAYALVRDGAHGISVTGDGVDWSGMKRLRQDLGGEFLWFRDGGKAYVIQDRATLDQARAAWEPVEVLGKQMEANGHEMERHGKEMERLGKEMEQAARGADSQRAMQDVSLRMNAASKPMDALGKKMDGLGKQMDVESKRADQAVHALIRDAKARGLAKPAPQV